MHTTEERAAVPAPVTLEELRALSVVEADAAVTERRAHIDDLEAQRGQARAAQVAAESGVADTECATVAELAAGGQFDEAWMAGARRRLEDATARVRVLDLALKASRPLLGQALTAARIRREDVCLQARREACEAFLATLAPVIAATAHLHAVEREAARILGGYAAFQPLAWREFVRMPGRPCRLDAWYAAARVVGVDLTNAPDAAVCPASPADVERQQVIDDATARRPMASEIAVRIAGGEPQLPPPQTFEDRLRRRARGEREPAKPSGFVERMFGWFGTTS